MGKKVWLVLIAVALLCPLAAGAEPVNSKMNVDFYGYLKLDTVYSTAFTVQNNFLDFVPPGNLRANHEEQRYRDRDSFAMTARQSRFGFLINGPASEGGISTRARIEMDFYGSMPATSGKANQNGIQIGYASDPAENKGAIMLRRATVEIIGDTWAVLAGNEWMVVSPLAPHVNNYTYAADVGNLGYRTPQIRFTGYAMDKQLILELAACNKMGDVDTLDIDTGRMHGAPTWEGGITYKTKEGLNVGLTGHYGMEEMQTRRANLYGYFGSQIESWSYNLHFNVPMGEIFAVSGEYYEGANLDGWYTGGQGNGWVVTEDGEREPLHSFGGWAELMIKPADNFKIYTGYGIDDVSDDQLRDGIIEGDDGVIPATATYFGGVGNKAITKNVMYYTNLNYNINAATMISLEWMQMISTYDNARELTPAGKLHWENGKVDRYTLSFWYMF